MLTAGTCSAGEQLNFVRKFHQNVNSSLVSCLVSFAHLIEIAATLKLCYSVPNFIIQLAVAPLASRGYIFDWIWKG